MSADPGRRSAITSSGYRLYTGSQAVSVVGTMMTYTALYWLVLHIARGNALVLSVLVAAQFLPMLVFSRRAGTIVSRHQAVRVRPAAAGRLGAGLVSVGPVVRGGLCPGCRCPRPAGAHA